jgi:hypothetical protein
MTIFRVLHERVLYPYHLQRVQGVMPADSPARENLCPCFVQRSAEFFFVLSVVFIVEARFGGDEIISIHNQHQWVEENPHGVFQSRPQTQFSITVWARIVGDCLAGPHVLPHRPTGNNYRDIL